MEIIISGEDKKLMKQVETLAKKLGLQINKPHKEKSMKEEKNKSKKLHQLMEEAAVSGGLFSSIEDPVAWQNEVRKDRPMPGREL